MRIIPRAEFLQSPIGTLFHEYEPLAFGPLKVFEGFIDNQTIAKDFRYGDVSDPFPEQVAREGFESMLDVVFQAEHTGEPMPLVYGEGISRDGLYEVNQLYAVYERADVERLIEYLNKQLLRAYSV